MEGNVASKAKPRMTSYICFCKEQRYKVKGRIAQHVSIASYAASAYLHILVFTLQMSMQTGPQAR